MGANNFKDKSSNEPRINYDIVGHKEVRLIYKEHSYEKSENDFNKIVSWQEAVNYSKKYHLDLIEINSNTTPIIVRLANYSKYMYEQKKLLKQRNKSKTELKEVQLKANISMHDLEIKIEKAKEFIKKGDKVKVALSLKGRELSRREESKKCFYIFIQNMLESGIASLESQPRDEEKNSYVIFKKK